jgi:hypothetical protein
MSTTYRLCMKLANVHQPWFTNLNEQNQMQPWRAKQRERLADSLFQSTWRADKGANWQAHQADVMLTANLASLIRQDMTPAAALEYLGLL